jgi:hypothetical protein
MGSECAWHIIVGGNEMSFVRYLVFALGALISLSACGDLTRTEAARVLNGEARGSACETQLEFAPGGFASAKERGAFTVVPATVTMAVTLKVADTSDGDRWQLVCLLNNCTGAKVHRMKNQNRCLPGQVEVRAIAEMPMGGGNFKQVDYDEVVTVPPELASIAPYVRTRFQKSIVFQKTDRGWRVAR